MVFNFAHLLRHPQPDDAQYFYVIKGEEPEETKTEFKTDNKVALTGKVNCEYFGVVDFYVYLPFIAGLGLSKYLPVSIEDSSIRKHSFKAIIENSEDLSIVDILGEYDSKERHVKMYVNLIADAAEELLVDYQILYEVVLVHELTHAITHLAYDEDGEYWEWFSIATSESKELLAQLVSFILFRECRMLEHIDAMEKLSLHQPSKYNTYQKYQTSTVEEVREVVAQERNRIVMSRRSDVAFQVSFSSDGVYQELNADFHVMADGRVLASDYPAVYPRDSEHPFVEDESSKIFCHPIDERISEPTMENLKKSIKHIISLEQTEFGSPGLWMDVTSQYVKVTLDGFTRTFSTHNPPAWGSEADLFNPFLLLLKIALLEVDAQEYINIRILGG